MWDFHRYWIYGVLIAVALATCSSCGGKMTDKEFIEAVHDAGCNLQTIKRPENHIERIDCHDTVRYDR